MNETIKRIGSFVLILLFAFSFGFMAGDRRRAAINRDRIDELGELLDSEVERNRELTEINNRNIAIIADLSAEIDFVRAELARVIGQLDMAKGALGKIGEGLAEDAGTVRDLIERIRAIREALREYKENVDRDSNSGNP